MSESLSQLLVRLRRAPETRATLQCPMLLWSGPASAEGEHWEKTRGISAQAPLIADPQVFRVEKGSKASNAFTVGITLGRVDSNDLVIEDDSVSRFHAFLRFDELTRTWLLTDAESKNGTWVDGVKLAPSQPRPVADGSVLRFGDAELTFLLPASFLARIDA